jgi:hypothetical protein
MKKVLPLLAVLAFLINGCSRSNSPTLSPTEEILASSAVPPVTAASADTATETAPAQAIPFTFQIDSPHDGDVVSATSIDLTGTVSADAVVSVNEDIFQFPAGAFKQPITLNPGVNVLQIIASDTAGDEIDLVINITVATD